MSQQLKVRGTGLPELPVRQAELEAAQQQRIQKREEDEEEERRLRLAQVPVGNRKQPGKL